MKTQFIIGSIVVLLLGTLGAWVYFNNMQEKTTAPDDQENIEGEPAVVITRTKDGYEPKEVTVQVGDIVEWVNESGEFHWPASDLHPTHGVYPEFDPLRPIADGESWKFKFDQAGVWKYHDHIRANKVGTITVQ